MEAKPHSASAYGRITDPRLDQGREQAHGKELQMHRGLLLHLRSVQKAEPPCTALGTRRLWSRGRGADELSKAARRSQDKTCGYAEGRLLLWLQSSAASDMNASALLRHAKKVPDQRSKEVKTARLENMNSLAQVSCINLKKKQTNTHNLGKDS